MANPFPDPQCNQSLANGLVRSRRSIVGQPVPSGQLPLGLSFNGERLYSNEFYDLVLHSAPRTHGVGSIVGFPKSDGGVTMADRIGILRRRLAVDRGTVLRTLGPDAAGRRGQPVGMGCSLATSRKRSPARWVQQRLAYSDRIVHYRDLVPAGTVSVCNEGVTTGRLLYVGEEGADFGDATADDVIITEHVPDWLPPAAGLITSDLQTPLAHVSLLARNRGIPNASQADVHVNAGLRQAARVHAYAIVIARGSTLQIALITSEQYQQIKAAQRPVPAQVPAVVVTAMPLIVNLTELVAALYRDGLTQADIEQWRPIIGGKSAGFLTLLSTPGLTPPPDPLAITVKAYVEHMAPLRATLVAIINDPALAASPGRAG